MEDIQGSECASSSNEFIVVASQNHLLLLQRPKNNDLLENIRKDIQCPRLDLNQKFPDLLKAVDDIDGFQLRSHPPGTPDRYRLMEVKYDIFHHVRRFKRLLEYNSPRKEVECRPAIDDLVALAFCHRHNAQHIFKCEAELFLPAEPFTATADIATFLYMPEEWMLTLTELNYDHHSFAFCALTGENHLLTFAVEAKSKPSANDTFGHQLALYLCSAQHQRRALGFTNHIIYGLTLVGHIAKLFVSSWAQNTVVVAPTRHEFDLSSFSQHMELFVVLCRLAEKFEEQFEEMQKQSNDPSILAKNKEAVASPWRLPFKPSKPRKKVARSTHTDGMTSDSEGDSDLFEEDFFGDSFDTSKSFMTPENDGYNKSQVPLKAEILEQHTPTETTMLPPAKDIATWAQRIADEVQGRNTIPP